MNPGQGSILNKIGSLGTTKRMRGRVPAANGPKLDRSLEPRSEFNFGRCDSRKKSHSPDSAPPNKLTAMTQFITQT